MQERRKPRGFPVAPQRHCRLIAAKGSRLASLLQRAAVPTKTGRVYGGVIGFVMV